MTWRDPAATPTPGLCGDQWRIGLLHDTQLSIRNTWLRYQKTQPHRRSEQMYNLKTRSPVKHNEYFKIYSVFQVSLLLLLFLENSKIYPGLHDNFPLYSKKGTDQFSALLYDEMTIICCLSYNTYMDCIAGLEGYGAIGKTWFMANNALIFMVRGLVNKWKQCIVSNIASITVHGLNDGHIAPYTDIEFQLTKYIYIII